MPPPILLRARCAYLACSLRCGSFAIWLERWHRVPLLPAFAPINSRKTVSLFAVANIPVQTALTSPKPSLSPGVTTPAHATRSPVTFYPTPINFLSLYKYHLFLVSWTPSALSGISPASMSLVADCSLYTRFTTRATRTPLPPLLCLGGRLGTLCLDALFLNSALTTRDRLPVIYSPSYIQHTSPSSPRDFGSPSDLTMVQGARHARDLLAGCCRRRMPSTLTHLVLTWFSTCASTALRALCYLTPLGSAHWLTYSSAAR